MQINKQTQNQVNTNKRVKNNQTTNTQSYQKTIHTTKPQ